MEEEEKNKKKAIQTESSMETRKANNLVCARELGFESQFMHFLLLPRITIESDKKAAWHVTGSLRDF